MLIQQKLCLSHRHTLSSEETSKQPSGRSPGFGPLLVTRPSRVFNAMASDASRFNFSKTSGFGITGYKSSPFVLISLGASQWR